VSLKINIPSKQELQNFYYSTKSISKTAKHFQTSNPTVRKWLDAYAIRRFTHTEAVEHDFHVKSVEVPKKEDLIFIYRNMPISDIRRLYNIGQETFYDWLKMYDIDRIDISTKTKQTKQKNFAARFCLTKEKIQKDYEAVQCMGGLAEKYQCSMTTIKKLFKMYDVEARFAKSSVGQLQVEEFVKSLGFTTVSNNRKIIYPLEIDIVVPEKNLAIEYCGVYFHSETWGNKNKTYHKRKYDLCAANGYKLITIFESEWNTKRDIVKSIIRTKLGMNQKKIPARKTIFKELEYKDVRSFETENHLQGTRPAGKYFGLFYENVLVMSLSIGKSRFNKQHQNEIIRMTSKQGVSVIGGISKLMKNSQIKECVTYADKRYGDGLGYLKSGFTKLSDSAPNYFYFHKKDHNTLHSRNKFQKHKIPNVDLNLTEYENMQNQNYDRIWDCGNCVYKYIQ
jgi:transposase